MNRNAFLAAIKYINSKSLSINIAPTIYVRTTKEDILTDPEYIVVRDIEHNNNVNIIPYTSIIMIHE